MHERIKQLRKSLHLTQSEFALRIGITQGTLSGIENGKVSVSNQNILSICREFCISEEWLKFGKEAEALDYRRENVKFNAIMKNGDAFKKSILLTMINLDDNGWKALKHIIIDINRRIRNERENN